MKNKATQPRLHKTRLAEYIEAYEDGFSGPLSCRWRPPTERDMRGQGTRNDICKTMPLAEMVAQLI